MDADPGRDPGDETGERARRPALLLQALTADKCRPDDRPSRIAERLGREADRLRLYQRPARVGVAPVERDRREGPPREPGRRESRYRHLFGGDVPQETEAHAAESVTSVTPRVEAGADASILARLEALEAAVESLQRQLRSSSAADQ